MKNKLVASLLLILLCFSPVHALSLEERAKNATENAKENIVGDCVLAYHGFLYSETYIPFQGGKAVWDTFKLTQCQAVDMLLLYDELNSLRDQMRSQAISCQPYEELKATYMKLKLEQIFVREVWPYRLVGLKKERLDAETAAIPERLSILNDSMKERFIGEGKGKIKLQVVDEDLFDTWFEEWTAKYESRIPNYIRCKQDAWAQVTQVKDSITYKTGEIILAYWKFKDALKIKQNVANYYKNLGLFQKQAGENKRFNFFGFSENATGALAKEMENWKESWLDAMDTQEAIRTQNNDVQGPLSVEDLSGGISFEMALEQLNGDEDRLKVELEHLDREAKYTLRYGHNGALVQEKNNAEIYEVTQSLRASKYSILGMLQTGEKIYERQCR